MTAPGNPKIASLHPPGTATARPRRRVFVRDLVLAAEIGVHGHEHGQTQPVCINVDLLADDQGAPEPEGIGQVVCYEAVVTAIRHIVSGGHIQLVETLAERIAEACLADGRVAAVRIRVEKPAAITEAAGVGVEITRFRPGEGPESARF